MAHELFHLVQFSYFSTGADLALPDWVQEGTAGGIERRANPNLDDVLWDIQARDWLATPSRSIASFPYAAELFWHYADRTNSRLLPEFVAALAHGKTGALAALQTVCGRVGVKSVAHLFHDFAVTTYTEQGKLSPTGWLAAPRASVTVKPLALQYLRLPVPVGLGYHVTVTLSTPSDSRYVTLAYRARPKTAGEWPQMVKVKPIRQTAHAVTWRLRPSSKLEDPSLLLTASCVSRATTFEFRITKVDRPH